MNGPVAGTAVRGALCAVLGGILSLALFDGCAREAQDASDRRALLGLFGLRDEYALTAYQGFPAVAGFGQREGLALRAEYRLTEAQVRTFGDWAPPRGWEAFPPPGDLRAKVEAGFSELAPLLGTRRGFYLCLTAGDDVLRARHPVPFASVKQPNDIILGVLDADSRTLHLAVRSHY